MTEKRFTGHYNEFLTWFEDNGEKMSHQQIITTLNQLNDENKQLKQENERLRNKNNRLHKDWDKLYLLVLDKGFTEDEILKELRR